MSKVKLFCFPYAGGSAVVYKQWRPLLHPDIDLRPVELAARGSRIKETPYRDLEEAVDDVFQLLKDDIEKGHFMLFGHSMGAVIAYHLAHKIRRSQMREPLHLFFSGHSAPHLAYKDSKVYHLMTDEDFKREVFSLGGTPPEFFQHPELVELFLPLLKNDFRISETSKVEKTITPFNRDITVLLGKDDDLTHEQCDGWKEHTNRLCTIHHFKGGHFFFHAEMKHIVKVINNTVKEQIHVVNEINS